MLLKRGHKLKIAIGTAQAGSEYGVANTSGILVENEIKKILEKAENEGVDTIDTASNYGNSEAILGNLNIHNFNVITKLPAVPKNCLNIRKWVAGVIEKSLLSLKVEKIYGILFHEPNQLLSEYGDELYRVLEEYKNKNIISKIGISNYSPTQLDLIIHKFPIDIVQAPLNLVDRRILNSGWLDKLSARNIEIHIRSVFLQGLLLIPYNQIPNEFLMWDKVWIRWNNWLSSNNVSAAHACISFANSFEQINKIIVGVDCLNHFEEIVTNVKKKPLTDIINIELEDELLINPSNWRLK